MPAKRPDSQTTALGLTVARLRSERGWQQSDLARELGIALQRPIDPTLITRLEKGRRVTSTGELTALASVLGVPPAALLSDADPFYDDGYDEWRMRSHMRAARDALERAAREYGATRFAFESIISDDRPEDASAIADRAETDGWNGEAARG